MSRSLSALALAALFASACSSPSSADGGAGPGSSGAPDGSLSLDAGCAVEGASCISVPCCNPGSEVCSPAAFYNCAPILVPDAGADAGPADAGLDAGPVDAGPTDAGADAGPADGGPHWVVEGVVPPIAAVDDLVAPAPGLAFAVGAGSGSGALISRGGGAPVAWAAIVGEPATAGLFGVFADPAGDLVAAGSGADGGAALLSGSLDGGLASLPVSALADVLLGVLGVGPGELYACGRLAGAAVLLHAFPDGGVSSEPLPAPLAQLRRLRGGPVAYALGSDPSGAPEILERADGGWIELPPSGAVTLSDISVDPAGGLVAVGDDGAGNGLAFAWSSDGGFSAIDLSLVPGGAPPLSAVFAAAPDDLYLAGTPSGGSNAEIVRLGAGAAAIEPVDAEPLRISALAGDGAGDRFAAGTQGCRGCAPAPMILRRRP